MARAMHIFFIVVKELSQVLNRPGLWKAGRPLQTQGVPEPRPHSVPTPVFTASARGCGSPPLPPPAHPAWRRRARGAPKRRFSVPDLAKIPDLGLLEEMLESRPVPSTGVEPGGRCSDLPPATPGLTDRYPAGGRVSVWCRASAELSCRVFLCSGFHQDGVANASRLSRTGSPPSQEAPLSGANQDSGSL